MGIFPRINLLFLKFLIQSQEIVKFVQELNKILKKLSLLQINKFLKELIKICENSESFLIHNYVFQKLVFFDDSYREDYIDFLYQKE